MQAMGMQIDQEDLENKKRKAAEKEESSKGQIDEHFQRSQKLKAPSALRSSTHAVTPAKKGQEEESESKCKGKAAACLCAMADVPLDEDCAGRYRLVLTSLFASMRDADPDAVFSPHVLTLERAAEKGEKVILHEQSVDKITKTPRSIA